jgi:hypothetical protein
MKKVPNVPLKGYDLAPLPYFYLLQQKGQLGYVPLPGSIVETIDRQIIIPEK